MKTLHSLIRLHRAALDERRRALVALESRRAEIEAARRRMESQLRAEQRVAAGDYEAARAYGGFAQAVIRRRGELAAMLAELDREIALAVAALGEAYQEVKRYEVALENREKQRRAEAARRQQAAIDEVAIEMHRRKGRGSSAS
jgi:flagellar export protein FliJ